MRQNEAARTSICSVEKIKSVRFEIVQTFVDTAGQRAAGSRPYNEMQEQ